ncbi:MAG: sigma-70 family RNA polymerase sigma factor [Bacilli bacterium]|nr:sigma-70 family RNA polymerase sigma factor [Bacilli bacterium]
MDNLIEENSKLIYSLAHSFKNYQSKEDLYQVGCMGLIKAYKNYVPNDNTKFTTYAYPYILGEMKKQVREDKGIKISREINKLSLRIEKANILLSQKLMRDPTTKELSDLLEIDEGLVIECLKSKNCLFSLDETISDLGKDTNLYDVISKEDVDINTLIMLKEEINNLSEEQRKIITLRYLNDMTQAEVSNELGMSQVQISRKEQKVLTKLRNKMVA